ncbi:uncharacterized protein K489DRAFT_369038 [Dissoconium aciculare CBS 342.82]|uniref:Uncharacterized protein n=1 Tax=Dissoconium aciculare CBS 342.82 TaxID=1314786 RepID=A0A6J3M8C2_9PEZI|nr:uncharacterized protein K489DRAFT_369038 [Dissoconium aciculare CBS 342.82]KAF1824113.1 hypothetical protein K489DRAFT_369038 [Dissoconium aciculare CBS 342.82]
MNTIRSVGYGWGVLIVAGAGSYYFAKRSINADREERAAAEERRRQAQYRMRAHEAVSRDISMASTSSSGQASGAKGDRSSTIATSSGGDSGASASDTKNESGIGESRYEANAPFRSRKGDRFS